MNSKKIITILVVFTVTSIYTYATQVSRIYAFTIDNVQGSSIMLPPYQIYADGNQISDGKRIVPVESKTPTFFGYTLPNVIVTLTVQPQMIQRSITTNNTGYWVYMVNKPLSSGEHTLYISLHDKNGASTEAKLAATFAVPRVLSSSTRKIIVPAPSLQKFDYFTVSLIISGGVFISFILYLLLAKLHTLVDE